MAERYPGGVISKTPPVVTGPATSGEFAGEGGSASGVWTLDTVLEYEKAGAWPKPVLPRELYAWGPNTVGELGLSDVSPRSSPTQVGALTNWSQVSAGNDHTLSVKTDGTLWAWGEGNNGRLGTGNIIDRSSPVQVGALTNWSQVSAGGSHSAAIKTDNTLWTWGRGSYGRLGHNNTIDRSSPVQVGSLSNWAQVSARNNLTGCVAVKTDGTLWSWGANSFGELGHNNTINLSSPVQVGSLSNWAEADSGSQLAFAIKTDGTIWGWGRNNIYGRLGDGTVIDRSSPVQIGALTDWHQISSGIAGGGAIKTNGTLWAWGRNVNGQLGDNSTANKSSPVQIGSLTTWDWLNRGFYNTFAIKTDGTLWGWGDNSPNGQIGDNTIVDRSSPVQIGALTNWNVVVSGDNHTLAITKG
jgi:alpha-tubulin suppressor-like RCC1 family protein